MYWILFIFLKRNSFKFLVLKENSLLSLVKLMVSHDLLCLTITDQIEFDQLESNLIPKFLKSTQTLKNLNCPELPCTGYFSSF